VAVESPIDESERAGTGWGGFHYSRSGNRSVRKVIVPWEGWQTVRQNYLGYTIAPGDKTLHRFLPYNDGDDPNLVCTSVEVKGLQYVGQTDNSETAPMLTANKFQFAELTVTFETVRYNLGTLANPDDPVTPQLGVTPADETDRYCIKRIHPGHEYVTAKSGVFVWSNTALTGVDGSPPTGDAGIKVPFPLPEILPYQEIDVTWLDIPIEAYPVAAIVDCLGKVNDDSLNLPGFPPPQTYDAETIYLRNVSEEEMFFPDGSLGFNITYHFKFRPVKNTAQFGYESGWNAFPAPNGTFRRLYRKKTSDGPFLLTDFSQLFVSGI
jgi:hypothetical protein